MPDAEFEPIPMSATDKLREYYQNSLKKLSLDELSCISRTLGESENARNENGIRAPTINLTSTKLQSRNNQIDSLSLTHAAYDSFTFRKLSSNLGGIKKNAEGNHTPHETRKRVRE